MGEEGDDTGRAHKWDYIPIWSSWANFPDILPFRAKIEFQ